MNSKLTPIFALGVAVLTITGCSHFRSGKYAEDTDSHGGVGDVNHFYGQQVSREQEMELLSQNTFYFPYDGYEVASGDRLPIYAHAKKLIENPNDVIRIEGHTDERGSREYNVGLGERRAKAVAQLMMSKGVPRRQIHIVSYGKEKPFSYGHEESAWQQNRRATIVYESE